MKCPNCGEKLPEGAKFCGACGSMLAESVNMDATELTSAEELTVSGYEEGPNAAERTEVPEYAGEPVPTEEERVPEAEDISAESAQNSPDPNVPQTQGGQPAAGRSRKNNVLPVILIAAVIAVIVMVNVIMALLPTDEERWQEQYDLGDRYFSEGDYEQAIVAFTAAIGIDANLGDAYLGRAGAYAAAGMAESSEEYLTLAAADYAVVLDLYEDEEVTGEIYASRGDVYYALAALVESSDEEAAGGYRSAAVSDYTSAIDLGGAAEEVYIRAAEIYILQEEYYRALNVITEGLDVYPENGELLALYNETETLIEEVEETARLAAEQAELEEEQAALDALAEEYLETARAYEEAGELNAAIHTLYEAYNDNLWDDYDESLWDYYGEFYEEWKRIFVPITAIWLYNSEGEPVLGVTYEYDESKRIIAEYWDDYPVDDAETCIQYEYNGDDWAIAKSTDIDLVNPYSEFEYEYAEDERFLAIAACGNAYEGGSMGPAYGVEADPYGKILNEDSFDASDYNATWGHWDYMEITYDGSGLVSRIDCYLEGASSGYALIEYGEQ